MLIIYIALVFILIGIAFFALSTKTERKHVPAGTPTSSVQSSYGMRQSARGTVKKPVPSFGVQEHVFYSEDTQDSRDAAPLGLSQAGDAKQDAAVSSSSEPKIRLQQTQGFSPVDDLKKTIDEAATDEKSIPEDALDAVLYEDLAKAVSFGEGSDSISPDKFDSLKRLCAGSLQIGEDALTFRSEKTLYRFDFHRLKEVRGDERAVLIYPDTMTYPLLLLSPLDKSFADTVIDKYVAFRNGRE